MSGEIKIYRPKFQENIPRLGAYKNFYFPVGVGNNPFTDSTRDIIPAMATDAKHLNKYFSPTQLPIPRADHAFWKAAKYDAENPVLPFRDKMQMIYNSSIENGQVFSALRKKANSVLLKDYALFDDDGVEDKDATKLIDKRWFRLGLKYITQADDFGYTLITFGDMVNGNFPNLQVVRRAWISPDRLELSFVPHVPVGIPFMDPTAVDKRGNSFYDWSLYVSTPSENGISKCGYGMLYKVALYEIILRLLLGWNTDFVEMYGQPLRIAKTASDNEAELDELENSMKMLASAGYLITDKQNEIEIAFPEGGSGTGWQSYDNFEKRCVQHVSKIILGHANAMDEVPGKVGGGQGGVESPVQKALDDVEAELSRFTAEVVNDDWLPKLINLGVKIPDGLHFEFKNDLEKQAVRKNEDANFLGTAQWVLALQQAGKTVDSQWLADRLGIPIIDAPNMQAPSPEMAGELKARLARIYGYRS